MALNPVTLGQALAQVDINFLNQQYAARGAIPPVIDPVTLTAIEQRSQAYATAIHAWILTATVNTNVTTTSTTTNPTGTVNVTGTAVAQSNPAPIIGTATGTGTGIGTLS